MSSRIEELNLTIPEAVEIIEQQKVLIENFSLLRDLVVTPGYMHFHRTKNTADSLTTAWTYITGLDHKTVQRKHVDVNLTTGEIDFDLNGVYAGDLFIHVEGAASNEYELGMLDADDNVLSSIIFTAHDPGGHGYLHHGDIFELSEPVTGIRTAIRLTSGSGSITIRHWHVTFKRVDNYNIP